MSNLSVGQKIRTLRKEKGLTLVEVAGEAFTKGYISQVELGRVDPSFKLMAHIAKKLDVQVEQLFSLEEKINDQIVKLESYLISGQYNKVIDACDGIKLMKHSPSFIKMMVMLLKANYYMESYDKTIEIGREILINDEAWSYAFKLDVYSFIGLSLFNQSKFEEVIELYNEAFDFAEKYEMSHSKILANMYLNKATAYQILENFEKAIVAYEKTLTFAKTHQCNDTVLDAYLRNGFSYYKLGNFEVAKKYLFDALQLNRILDLKLPQAETLLVLSQVFFSEENYKATEVMLKKSINLFLDTDSKRGIVEAYYMLAKIHQVTNRIETGKRIVLDVIKLIKAEGIDRFEQNHVKDVAKLCMKYELHEEASFLFDKLMDE